MGTLDLSQDTIKQRRNLLVTSALLIFIALADVDFGNTIKLLGATLTIGKPETIHQGLLALLFYFLWRFYQYFTTDKAYSELCNQFGNYMQNITVQSIVKAICIPRGLEGLSGVYLYANLKRHGLFTYSIEAAESSKYDPTTGQMVQQDTFTAKLSVVRLELRRLTAALNFVFRARILTDYFVPYVLVIYAVYLQFV